VKEGGVDKLDLESESARGCYHNEPAVTISSHQLDPSSVPKTFPRVTKLANPIRESISSIVLECTEGETPSYNVSSAKREKYMGARAYRVLISLAHVISLRGGAFRQAPMIPRKSATRDSKTI
jgi:hypothetical protein